LQQLRQAAVLAVAQPRARFVGSRARKARRARRRGV